MFTPWGTNGDHSGLAPTGGGHNNLDQFDAFIKDPIGALGNTDYTSEEEIKKDFAKDVVIALILGRVLKQKEVQKPGAHNDVDLNGTKQVAKIKSTRVNALPKALQVRPKWRKSTINYLNANSPKDANGNFIDVKTGKPILGEKHIGHQKETWREYQDNPANQSKTREQVIDDYNNVENLGYESGPENSSNGAKTKGLENTEKKD